MRLQDRHIVPKFENQDSFLYVEHCRIDQEALAIAIHNDLGKTPVPCANLALLMIGPGVSITHAAVSVLSEHGCLIAWCGEHGVRLYAVGTFPKRSSANLQHQVRLWANPDSRMQVVRLLYQMRFSGELEENLSLREIRGKEGIRVRRAYEKAAEDYGVVWSGRHYETNNWKKADPLNRALSAANSCLYGITHAAITAAGFSPALGFIHSGSMTSFVFDIADLYKTEISIPIAFSTVSQGVDDLERRVRIACRNEFHKSRLLHRIIPDIQFALMMPPKSETRFSSEYGPEVDALWDPKMEHVNGGVNYDLDLHDKVENDDSPNL